jgi:N-acetyl-alpha-D-muramate 1-phosphate uridylyltransferase
MSSTTLQALTVMKAMILAAGKGERLAPLTNTVPKPLIEVGGESLIERHLTALGGAGFDRVVINVSHLGQLIERRVGDGAAFGLEIVYSREPAEPLETGGGIRRALRLLGEEAFLVVNADIWTDYDFGCCRIREDATAHIVLVPNPSHHGAGDFCLNGFHVERRDRNPYTYTGIGVFSPALFAGVPEGRFPLAPLLIEHAGRGRVSGEIHAGAWFDIGTLERLERTREMVAAGM